MEEMPAERNVVYYTCCPEPFPDVSYYIVMRVRGIISSFIVPSHIYLSIIALCRLFIK